MIRLWEILTHRHKWETKVSVGQIEMVTRSLGLPAKRETVIVKTKRCSCGAAKAWAISPIEKIKIEPDYCFSKFGI